MGVTSLNYPYCALNEFDFDYTKQCIYNPKNENPSRLEDGF